MVENKHIKSLDGLRGVAALIVVITHIEPIFPALGPLPAAKLGEQGVAIFFALSGFLMAYLYGGKPMTRTAAIDYLVHRFARIYPVYLVAVVISALLSAMPDLNYIDKLIGPGEIIRHVLLFGSQGVFWSIPPEIQFYLFFLLLWCCFAQPQKYQAVAIGIAAVFVIDAIMGFPGPGIMLPSKLEYFLLGALAGRLHATMPKWRPGFSVGLAALALLVFFIPSRVFGFLPQGHFWGLPSALASTVIVFLVACEHPFSAKVLASAPLRFAGMISFSLYLLHLPVMFFVNKWFADVLPQAFVIALSLLASLFVAWLSNRTIEGPARRFLVSIWRDWRIDPVIEKA